MKSRSAIAASWLFLLAAQIASLARDIA